METVLLWDSIGTLVLFLWAKRSMNIEFIPQNSPFCDSTQDQGSV